MCEKVIQHGWGWKAIRFASLPVAETFLFPFFSSDGGKPTSFSATNLTEPSHASNSRLGNVLLSRHARLRRMLSNRESARRSRRRKQAHLGELQETETIDLRFAGQAVLRRTSTSG